jgi:hypothetical protein
VASTSGVAVSPRTDAWMAEAGREDLVVGSGGAMVAPSVPARMRNSLLGYWHQAQPYQRLGYLVGGALVLGGLAHLVAWVVVGGAWAGPISFRKPTTFGISFGLTTITLAWVAGQLRISDRIGWLLLVPLAVADTAEVVWVSLQRWRGVASHFNNDSALDSLLFLIMGASPSMALAIRAGLLILLVAQVVGGWMIQHGLGPAEEGVTDGLTTFGAAGVMKVPHAMAIHAIQVLPALAWLLSFAALPEPRRLGLVRIAVVGYAALVAVSVLQTVTGAAPFDVGVVAVLLYLLGVGLLAIALIAALFALRHPAPA